MNSNDTLPKVSAAIMTPPLNVIPSTDVPVTIGLLQTSNNIYVNSDQLFHAHSSFDYNLSCAPANSSHQKMAHRNYPQIKRRVIMH